MSRKMDWADKEARKLADALGLDGDDTTGRALLAASLRLAYMHGLGTVDLNAKQEKADATT